MLSFFEAMHVDSSDSLRPAKSQICPNAKSCGGCSFWDVPIQQQIDVKRGHLYSVLTPFLNLSEMNGGISNEIPFVGVGPGFHRLWFDFQIRGSLFGLYSKPLSKDQDTSKTESLVDLEECYLLHPKLQKLFSQVRDIQFPNTKISARLRISPNGLRGIWLDLSNLEIKNLLIEKNVLLHLKKVVDVIEIGQKRKQVLFDYPVPMESLDSLKLTDPKPEKWFQSLQNDLYAFVGTFTQPSVTTANAITETILLWSEKSQNITEFGPGIGQYTVPLVRAGKQLDVFENNPLALVALKINAGSHLDLVRINPLESQNKDLYLVNPPRSGLGPFVEKIISDLPERIIYISCSVESLKKDLEKLWPLYVVTNSKLIDQFPQGPHFESVILLEKK